MKFKFILKEGKYDRETTFLSRLIINKIKEMIPSKIDIEDINIPQGAIKLFKQDLLIYINMKYYSEFLAHNVPKEDKVFVSGELASNEKRKVHLLIIDIEIPKKDTIQYLSFLIPALKDTIRHELEHMDQFQVGRKESTLTSGDWTMKKYLDYYTHPKESQAYAAGLYKRAKTSRQPFSKIYQKFESDIIYKFQNAIDYNPEIARKYLNKIRYEILSYYKQRFNHHK